MRTFVNQLITVYAKWLYVSQNKKKIHTSLIFQLQSWKSLFSRETEVRRKFFGDTTFLFPLLRSLSLSGSSHIWKVIRLTVSLQHCWSYDVLGLFKEAFVRWTWALTLSDTFRRSGGMNLYFYSLHTCCFPYNPFSFPRACELIPVVFDVKQVC